MGYYVEIINSTFKIPAENLPAAYEAMCALNNDNSQKRGGSYGGGVAEAPHFGAHETRWFSWMPWNYPETCADAQDIFEELGFDTHVNGDGDLCIIGYYNKAGQEDLFLEAVTPLATGFIQWRGEDGYLWQDDYTGGKPESRSGKVVF